MTGVIMETDLLRQFGDLHLTQGAMTVSAGTIDQAATIAAASAALGPIGSEFLAAFAGAQANHARAVAQLAAVYQATGVAAQAGAAGYDLTEADSAASFLAPSAEAELAAASAVSAASTASAATTASASSSELMNVADEVLQLAGQGVQLATSVGGEIATAAQQAAASHQAGQVAQSQPGAHAETAGNAVPSASASGAGAAVGAQRYAMTAGPAVAPGQSQPDSPGQTDSAAPGSDGIESS